MRTGRFIALKKTLKRATGTLALRKHEMAKILPEISAMAKIAEELRKAELERYERHVATKRKEFTDEQRKRVLGIA